MKFKPDLYLNVRKQILGGFCVAAVAVVVVVVRL